MNNPKKIGDWFKVELQISISRWEEYPLHLNTKYNIAEPTGITLKEVSGM